MKCSVQAVMLSFFLLTMSQANAALFGGPSEPQPIVLQAQGDRSAEIRLLLDARSELDKVTQYLALGKNRVAIGQIRVLFATKAGGGNSSGGGMFGGRQTIVDAEASIAELKPALVQTLVDGFTAQLTQALTQRGYTVLPQEKLMANTDYAAAVAKNKSPVIYESGIGLVDADGHGPLLGDTGVVAYAKQTATPIGTFQRYKGYNDLSKSLDNAVVLDLEFTVDFADFIKGEESGFFSSSISVKFVPTLSIRHGFLNVYSGGTLEMVKIPFKQIVKLGGEIAAKVVDNGSTALQTGLQVMSVITHNSGGSNFKGTSYEVTLVDNYGEVVSKELIPFAELISNALPQVKSAR